MTFVNRSSGLDGFDHCPSGFLEQNPVLDADVEQRHGIPSEPSSLTKHVRTGKVGRTVLGIGGDVDVAVISHDL